LQEKVTLEDFENEVRELAEEMALAVEAFKRLLSVVK
jgi:hypothetical protein